MGRSPCCDESGLKKGPWTPEEDQKLVIHIQKHGHGSWRALPKLAGLNRCGKSCRLRWTNYLRPDIKRGKFSQEEEQTILNLHSILGNKWSAMATHLPGRTDNEIKNFWNTHLKKKLIQMGLDPMTHRPRTDLFSSLPQLIALANLKELMETNQHSWEDLAGRLQTEAVQMARLQYLQHLFQPPPSSLPNYFSNNKTNSIDMRDMETFNLLMKSISSNNMINTPPVLDTPTSLSNSYESVPFAHLPDLQVPVQKPPLKYKDMVEEESFDFSRFCQGDETYSIPTSPWFPSSSSFSSPSPPSVAPPPTETTSISGANLGDACSTSSYGGAPQSFWPEFLLEDPLLFHELA